MSKDNKDQMPAVLPEKYAKVIAKMPEFKDTADASSVEDLKKIIVTCEGNIYTINQDEASNVKLSAAKDMVKELSEPYRDAKKVQQAKIQYSLFLLENKGVDLNNKDDNE